MRRVSRSLASFLIVAVVVVSSRCGAQPPDTLRSYEFLPRFSELNQSGGFAGVDIDFRVMGTYDFVTSYSYTPAALKSTARFANVEAWASHPVLAYVLLLDPTLNLSELEGRHIVGTPDGIEIFGFRGKDGQGAPFRMHVATLGRWMYMRGSNDPGCCDFFEYDFRALARQTPSADLDADGEVSSTDLATWRDGYSRAQGYDGADFLRWQRTLGETPPSLATFDSMLTAALASAEVANLAAVPEPQSLLLAGCCLGLLAPGRRHRS